VFWFLITPQCPLLPVRVQTGKPSGVLVEALQHQQLQNRVLMLTELWQRFGLDSGNPMSVSDHEIVFGGVIQTVAQVGDAFVVTRQ
jgi:hypothetical protein